MKTIISLDGKPSAMFLVKSHNTFTFLLNKKVVEFIEL